MSLAATTFEQEILETARGLLRELGAQDAVEKLSLDAAIDRDLGLGSLERVELLLRVEKRVGKRLPDEAAQGAETLREWLEALEGAASHPAAALRDPPAGPRPTAAR
jgi:fatty-acyl-CoA synthase